MSASSVEPTPLDALVEAFARNGFCVLRNHFPREKLRGWNATFRPLLERQVALEGATTSRGSNRYYVTLPFDSIFADAAIYEDETILAIVERLVGKDFVLCPLAADTPLLGSDYQGDGRERSARGGAADASDFACGLHRGTPNRSDFARPMVVIGYSRKWLHRPEVSIQIPRRVFAGLSERASARCYGLIRWSTKCRAN